MRRPLQNKKAHYYTKYLGCRPPLWPCVTKVFIGSLIVRAASRSYRGEIRVFSMASLWNWPQTKLKVGGCFSGGVVVSGVCDVNLFIKLHHALRSTRTLEAL